MAQKTVAPIEQKEVVTKRTRLRLGLNPFGLISACFMAASMFFPWWSFQLQFTPRTYVFPYIVKGPSTDIIGYTRTSLMALLIGAIVLATVLCLLASVLRGRVWRILMVFSGILCFLVIWRFVVRITGMASAFGVPLQGHGTGSYGGLGKMAVYTFIDPGLYFIAAGGILALISALLLYRIWLGNTD